MHINLVEGDYIYYEWVDSGIIDFLEKIKELESEGYILNEMCSGFLHEHREYKSTEGQVKTVTLCMS